MEKKIRATERAERSFDARKINIIPADFAFAIAAGFLTAILAASLGWSTITVIGWIATVVIMVSLCRIFPALSDFWRWAAPHIRITLPAACLAAFIMGLAYYHVYFAWQTARTKLPTGKSATFTAIVTDEPSLSAKSTLLKVELEKPYAGALTVFAPLNSHYAYGDELKIQGEMAPALAASPAPTNPAEAPAVFPRSIQLLAHHRAFWLRDLLIRLKLAIIARYNEVLPADQAMLLGGIAFGAKQNFSADLKNAMALSGTTHLVAISGYNITIVIVAVDAAIAGWLSRRAKFWITNAIIVLFVLMTGLQSSAIRAAIMGFLALAAKQSGRVFSMRNAITLTAAAMVALQPAILVHDAGFELSFMSLLGIVCCCDPLKAITDRWMHYDAGSAFDWKEGAVTTAAAQLGTMPILIAVFNQFSATAIFANVLVLGTMPLTMLLGFLLAVFAVVPSIVSFVLARLTSLLLAYQLGVIQLFARLAVLLPLPFNSPLVFVIYYASLGWFVYEYRGIRL